MDQLPVVEWEGTRPRSQPRFLSSPLASVRLGCWAGAESESKPPDLISAVAVAGKSSGENARGFFCWTIRSNENGTGLERQFLLRGCSRSAEPAIRHVLKSAIACRERGLDGKAESFS